MVQKRWIVLGLLLMTGICFGHVCLGEFLQWDDQLFVTENPHVLHGLNSADVRWAFTTLSAGWVPMTWLSLQLDATLFGPDAAWGFHLTNLLLHAGSVVLFFFILERMTGELWPSAICAALFAIHPLRVESVAWIAERRDVLCMILLLATVTAYHHYTKRPGWGRYALVLLTFGLGLATKQILVTLPFALLLLDYWPLGRLRWGQMLPAKAELLPRVSWKLVVMEKAPMLGMALVISFLVFRHVREVGGMSSDISWLNRVAVSLVAYLGYLEKTFWPTDLAAMYPFYVPPWRHATLAALVLVGITAMLAYFWRSRPMLIVGWLWFVGTLFPVSGIVQIGMQSLADRYTYVPHLGLLITVVWGIGGLTVWQKASGFLHVALVVMVLAAMGTLTWVQVCYWQNSEVLFRHTLSITQKNYVFHAALGSVLEKQGRSEEAVEQIAQALEIAPERPDLMRQYGTLLVRRERYQQAVTILERALRRKPDDGEAHQVLGVALERLGRKEEARLHYEQAIAQGDADPSDDFYGGAISAAPRRKVLAHLSLCELALRDNHPDEALAHAGRALALQPDLAEAYQLKGIALGRLRRWPEAETALKAALRFDPKDAASRGYLAFAYQQQNKKDLASREYADLVIQHPDWPGATNDFAIQRVTKKAFLDPMMAEELAQQVCESSQYSDPRWLDTLAAAQAARGQYIPAQQTARKALTLNPYPPLARQLQERLSLYDKNQPLPTQ